MEESGEVSSCGEGLGLSEGGERKSEKVGVGPEESASVTGKFGPYSVQECGDALCSGGVGTVAEDDWMAVTENDESVREEKA